MDQVETADFYELTVERHQKLSTVVTSNRDPSEWIGLMSDPLLAQAADSAPKTERGKRTLPLTDVLHKVLLRTKRRQAEERLKAGEKYRDSSYLIVNELGLALYTDTLSGKWDERTKTAGVRRITLHDARHTCGTLMHLQGVPIAIISAWLGHATADFTIRTYIHSQPEALREATFVFGSLGTSRPTFSN